MRLGQNRFGLALVSLLSLAGVGCGGEEEMAGNAAPALVESQKALAPATKTHLVMLSGQSNMARMIWSDSENQKGYLLKEVFEPRMRQAFPNDEFIFVSVAYGGRAIAQWVNDGRIYNEMLAEAKQRIVGKNIASVTFLWRQGEEDHNDNALARAYEGNLRKLYAQLKADFPGHKINWMIGRLNDAKNRMTPDWEFQDNWLLIRKNEKDVAASLAPLAVMVDCDTFNDLNNNEIHGSPADYLKQQRAFADAAIDLIKANQ